MAPGRRGLERQRQSKEGREKWIQKEAKVPDEPNTDFILWQGSSMRIRGLLAAERSRILRFGRDVLGAVLA